MKYLRSCGTPRPSVFSLNRTWAPVSLSLHSKYATVLVLSLSRFAGCLHSATVLVLATTASDD